MAVGGVTVKVGVVVGGVTAKADVAAGVVGVTKEKAVKINIFFMGVSKRLHKIEK